ncbi:MAG: SDR family oxidoreductase, partial [bacterium]|nr:SDR family oxidoreductase [bacterium]
MSTNITLITGGSSGLGFAIAKKLARKGKNICLTSRGETKLSGAVSLLKDQYKNATIISFPCNIGSEASVKKLFDFIESSGFEPDQLINCAGIGMLCEPDAATEELVDKVLEANLKGLILVTTYAIKKMTPRGGQIVNILSTHAKKGLAEVS